MYEQFSRISWISATLEQNSYPSALNRDPVHAAEFISCCAIISQLVNHDVFLILVGNVKCFVVQVSAR
jgi:hypothetical protein